jgi:hypothetical protein
MAGAGEADAAVAAAKEAYATWRTSPLTQRIAILFRYRALLDARRDDIAALITAEQGKVHADALAEVARGLEIVELACGLGMALKGDTSTEVSSRVDVASIRQPLGVIDPPRGTRGRGRPARRCAQHSARRRGRGERAARPPGRGRRVVRGLDAGRPATSTAGRLPAASASKPSAARRTTC